MGAAMRRLRSILVTGSGSGIGAATVRRLAAPGVGLVIHARVNQAGCERVAEGAREAGAEARVITGDLAEPQVASDLAAAAVAAFGGLDVLIANAGFGDARPFGTIDLAGFEKVHDVVAGGFFRMVTAALPHLEEATDGRVIAISAVGAHVYRNDIPSFPASAAAKAALEAMTRCLAVQLAPLGVTANAVAPGFIEKDPGTHSSLTPEQWADLVARIPFRRIGRQDEVAAMVAFLASRDSSYISGQVIHVNGGLV